MVKKAFNEGSFEQVQNQMRRGKVKKPFPTMEDVENVAKREVKRKGR